MLFPEPYLVTDRTQIRSANQLEIDASLSHWDMFRAAPVTSGVEVNPSIALNYSAFWCAVSYIASQCAMLPLCLFSRDAAGDAQRATDHPLYALLHSNPNPEMTGVAFREALLGHMLSWGNAYAEIQWRGDGMPQALWLLTPNRVQPFRTSEGHLLYRVSGDFGRQRVDDAILPPSSVLHFHGFSFDGINGYGVSTQARESIGLSLAAERFGGAFFGNGATFGGVLKFPNKLQPEVFKAIRNEITKQHVGLSRSLRLLMLEGGAEYQQMGVPPEAAQFLESRSFQVQEIARWFHLPPHKLRLTEGTTSYASLEIENTSVANDALMPWLKRVEAECNRKLVTPESGLYVEHVVDGLLRGDTAARSKFYREMWGIGALTINQILKLESLPSAGPDGDVRFVPANMVPMPKALATPDPAPESEPVPEQEPEAEQDPADA